MNQNTTWAWTIVGNGMHASGTVSASDPRDAVSFALTRDAGDAQLQAERFGLPVAILDGVPANFDRFYECMSDGDIYVSVQAADHRAEHPRTMLELKALWKLLGRVPVFEESSDEFEDNSIEEPYLHFAIGTPREDIWHWFEAQNPNFIVGEVMMGVWRI